MCRLSWLALTSVCLLVFTFSVVAARNEIDEEQAIGTLRSHGINIKIDARLPGKPSLTTSIFLIEDLSSDRKRPRDFSPIREFKSLRRIELEVQQITDSLVDSLERLPELEEIQVIGGFVDDEGADGIARNRNLRTLGLYETSDITDRGMRRLGRLANLQELRIKMCPITGAGLIALSRMPKLRDLSLDWCKITDEGMKAIGPHPSLESLSLLGTQITDLSVESLKGIPKLREVAVSSTFFTRSGVAALRKARPGMKIAWDVRDRRDPLDTDFPHRIPPAEGIASPVDHRTPQERTIDVLEEAGVQVWCDDDDGTQPAREMSAFILSSAIISEKTFSLIRQLKLLREASLTGPRIGDSYARHLGALKELESVILVDTRITDKSMETLSQLNKLREVTLAFSREVSDRGVSYLGKLTNLEKLVLTDVPKLTGPGLLALQKTTKLRDLDLSWTSVTDEGVKGLVKHPALERLVLEDCPISDESLKLIEAMPKLRELVVYGTKVTKTGTAALRKARPGLIVRD
jgi:Leucine-rich repeat (LRR) protein